MTANSNFVRCPKCGRKQPVRSSDALYRCPVCQVTFDNDPDEGGTYSDRDPAARLEREERQRAERHDRTRSRMGRR